MRDYDLIVIGGGSAGLVVAGGAAQLGARVALVELGSMIHVYPTLTQVNQQAGVDAILKGLSAYKKWLSYYFKIWR